MRTSKILLASLMLALSAGAFSQSVASVTFDPPSLSPGQTTIGTVYLSGPAPAAGVAVTLKSSRTGFGIPASVTVASGQSSAQFSLSTATDSQGLSIITATGGGTSRKTSVNATNGPFWSFERMSLSSTAAQANAQNGEPYALDDGDSRKISADGRYVVFSSQATNLVANDRNRKMDVFFRDRQLGTTVRVSELPTGVDGNGNSYQPSLSADGNFVAFVSESTNLVSGDANGQPDVFLWNRATKAITVVSKSGSAWANDASFQPSISKTGRYVAYESFASNLDGSDTNGWADIYVFDATKGTSKRASVGNNVWAVVPPNGDCGGPSISGDGRYVAFESFADNLVDSDTNDCEDVFVRDMNLHTTARVSIDPLGMELDGFSFGPSISSDGKVVAFSTYATLPTPWSFNDPFAKILVRDMTAAKTDMVMNYFGTDVVEASISANGRFVGFGGINADTGQRLFAGVLDRFYGYTQFFSNSVTGDVSLSGDGRYAAFTSTDRMLVPDDTNGKTDVFVVDAMGQQPVYISGPGQNGQNDRILAGDTTTFKIAVLQTSTTPTVVYLQSAVAGVTLPATVTIPAGALSASFTLATTADMGEGFVGFTATVNSRTMWAQVNVANAVISVPTTPIKPGTTFTAKIRLSRPLAAAARFDLYGPSNFGMPLSVNMAAGATTKVFSVQVPADASLGNYGLTAISGMVGIYAFGSFTVVAAGS